MLLTGSSHYHDGHIFYVHQRNTWLVPDTHHFLAIVLCTLGYRGRSTHLVRVQELYESWGGRPELPVLMNLMVSVDVKQHWTMLRHWSPFVNRHPRTWSCTSSSSCTRIRVQELCESQNGRPGLPVLMSLMVSVDVKQHWTVLRHCSQFVPDMLTNIQGHEALPHQQQQHTFGAKSSFNWYHDCV